MQYNWAYTKKKTFQLKTKGKLRSLDDSLVNIICVPCYRNVNMMSSTKAPQIKSIRLSFLCTLFLLMTGSPDSDMTSVEEISADQILEIT